MRIKAMKRMLIALTAGLMVTGAALAQDALPDQIVVARPGFSPEGIEWDAENGVFLLGSLADGTVYRVTDDGESTPFIEDEDIIVSAGIEVDAANRRLLVTSSEADVFFNFTSPGQIGVGAYDLDTGERQFFADLSELHPGRGFANDVAVDADGNTYVTDSFSPAIYKVDMDGNAELFVEDERLRAPFFGLNGIVAHPDGYLIVAVAGQGQLFNVPLDDPAALSEIALEQPLGADGLILDGDGNLIAVSGGVVYQLSSDDDFASATVIAQAEHEPATTVTLRDDQVYAIYAYLMTNTTRETYEIVRVEFS
jgi:sugar lactone lactonase YvrE